MYLTLTHEVCDIPAGFLIGTIYSKHVGILYKTLRTVAQKLSESQVLKQTVFQPYPVCLIHITAIMFELLADGFLSVQLGESVSDVSCPVCPSLN